MQSQEPADREPDLNIDQAEVPNRSAGGEPRLVTVIVGAALGAAFVALFFVRPFGTPETGHYLLLTLLLCLTLGGVVVWQSPATTVDGAVRNGAIAGICMGSTVGVLFLVVFALLLLNAGSGLIWLYLLSGIITVPVALVVSGAVAAVGTGISAAGWYWVRLRWPDSVRN